jgi:purine-binding chemotaxis protein CheW
VLVVVARGCRCALPLEQVVETMRPLPIGPVTNAPHYVLGLSIIRGAPLPVVDLGALLGRGGTPSAAPARVVTVRVGGSGSRQVAIAVDSVVGVRTLEQCVLSDLPPLLGASDVVTSLGVLDRELVSLLDGSRVLPDEAWARDLAS